MRKEFSTKNTEQFIREDNMAESLCSGCRQPYPDDQLLVREDNGERVCEECSGLLVNEDLSCTYGEW